MIARAYAEAAVAEDGGGFLVTLDGRPVQPPARARLELPTRALADAVAAEWAAQEGKVRPATMPLTRLAATAIDRVAPRRERVIDETAAYGASDLLCYRAAAPPDLAARQGALWQPLLEAAEGRFAARLKVTRGVAPVAQDAAALAALRARVAAHDDMGLAALHAATAAAGSLVIGLRLSLGEVEAEAAWAAVDLDEAFQAERFGADAAGDATRETRRGDLFAAARFLDLIRS